jgi:anti-anti-sigma factor
MALQIAQEEHAGVRILGPRGRLDTDTSSDLELAMQDLTAAGERAFLVDLGQVSYVSSAGLRVLLALAKQLDASGGSLRLCGLSAPVKQVFDVAGFSRLFVIFADRAAALAGIAKVAPVAPQAPTVAQHVARLLKVGQPAAPRSAQAAQLARELAQLLGVKPVAAAAAASVARAAAPGAASSAVEGEAPMEPAAPGRFGKLRGLFGGKR